MRSAGSIGLLALLLLIVPATAATPTFSDNVAPILYKHCASCHHPNDIAPMSLLTYQEVRPWASSIKEAVVTRKMPPWKADPHIGKWSNDPSLSAAEIETVKAWVDNGKPEGDRKHLRAAGPGAHHAVCDEPRPDEERVDDVLPRTRQ